MAREREQKALCCSERMGRAASWGLSWLRLAVSNPAADRSLLAQIMGFMLLSCFSEKAPWNGGVRSGLMRVWRSLVVGGGPGAFLGRGAELDHRCAVEPCTRPWPKPERGFSLSTNQCQEIQNACSQCFKTTPSPKAKPSVTKALSDGDGFYTISISVGSNLFLFTFCCCWQKKDLNEEYGAPIMCNLTWMCLHRIGEELDQGKA